MNVFSVEGGNEAFVQGLDDPLNDFVGRKLFEAELVAAGIQAIVLLDHVQELAGGSSLNGRHLLKHVEKLRLARNQTKTHDHFSFVFD